MNILATIITSTLAIFIGNFLGLLPYFILMSIAALFPRRYATPLLTLYLARIGMGATVGALFSVVEHFIGAELWTQMAVFVVWLVFFSDTKSQNLLSHDILKGNVKKYTLHKNGLKIARFVSFFILKLLTFALLNI